MSRTAAWAASLLLAVAPTAFGEAMADEPEDLREPETLVITGSHRPTTLERTAGARFRIDGSELEARQLDSALDSLRSVPGLHADQPGVRGSRSSLYLRGLDPSLTAVYLDGILLNDPTNARGGSFDFATLGSDSIAAIEVAKGGLSSVYGSDAIAGAVQILTRDGRGPDRAQLEARGGRFGTRLVRASFGGERGPFDLSASFSYADEDQPENLGSYSGTALHTKLGFRANERARIRAVLRTTESRSLAFPEFSGGPRFAVRRGFEVRDVHDLAAGLTLEAEPADWLQTEIRTSAYLRREDRRSPGVAPAPPGDVFGIPAEPDTVDRLQRYDALARATARLPLNAARGPGSTLWITAGANVRYEDGQSRGTTVSPFGPLPATFHFDRVIGGPFAELALDLPFGIHLQGGVRFDATNEGESEWSPRFGLLIPLHEATDRPLPFEVDLFASYGEGFKLPSFFALANPVAGNSALESETSFGGDTGVRLRAFSGRLSFSSTYFWMVVDELIDFDTATFRLENRARVRSEGVELGVRLEPVDGLWIEAHATYVDWNLRLRNRPSWRTGATLGLELADAIRARLTVLHVASILDASRPTGDVRLDDWTRVDLALEVRPIEHIALTFAVDNLFDAEYEEAVGFRAVSIRPRAGVRLTW